MDHNRPLISAIIPVYNRPEQIKEAIRSVINQTYRPLELIVGDDGSTDQTLMEVNTLQDAAVKAGVDLTILELTHTGMPGAVRNRCVQSARGEFIAFLDSDDLWLPAKLEKQYALHRDNPSLNISHTREEWNRSGKIISQSKLRHTRQGDMFADSLKKCIIGPSTVMIRRDYYLETGGFREDLEIAEDYEYWLRITAGETVAYLDEPMIVKRAGHQGQLSEKYGHIELFRLEGLKSLVDSDFLKGERKNQAASELANKCSVYSKGCLKRGKEEESLIYRELSEYYRKMAESH